MATLASLTVDVYEMLYGTAGVERPDQDDLSQALDDGSDVTCRFTTPTMWRRGDFAESVTDGEILRITADAATGSDTTVQRSQRGTTQDGGHAIGEWFRKNPKFTTLQIERAINDTVDHDLWPHVWVGGDNTITTYATTDSTYEVDANIREITMLYQYNLNSDNKLWPFPPSWWAFDEQLATAVSSTKRFLRIFHVHDSTADIYYRYRQAPTSTDYTTLSNRLATFVPYGVIGRLLGGQVTPGRSDPRRNTRANTGNQPLIDASWFRDEFERRRRDERQWLLSANERPSRWQRRGVVRSG